MTEPSRVIYLPPGVVPAPQNAQPIPIPSGIPFDRAFFETVLPQSIAGFCSQVECKIPVVELTTVDGTRHYVNGISGVADLWVALHTSIPSHEHPVQVFVPYQTIFRVEIHPEMDEYRQHLGFATTSNGRPASEVLPASRAKRGAAKK